MQVKLNTNDHIYKRELEISISAEEIAPIILAEKQKIRRKAEIPGFRKGKAPQNLVDRHYGKALIQDVIDHVVNDFYPKALDEAKISPVMQGEIKDLHYHELGSDLSFKVLTEVEPVVEVKSYSKMKLTKDVRHFREADLDDYFRYLREERATANSIDGPAFNDDIIVFDTVEIDNEDKPLKGKEYNDIRIKLGQGQFDTEVEKDLEGTKVGETKIIERIYPTYYEDKTLAGKSERFKATIKHIERLDLPELNDEFAKSLGQYESMADYREKISETMKKQFEKDSDSSLINNIVEQMIETNPFEIPNEMVKHELDLMFYNTQAQGQKMDEKVFRQYYGQVAEKTVKWRIIKKDIIKKVGLDASEEEIEEYLLENGWEKDKLSEALKNKYLLEQIEEELLQKKVTALIVKKAKVIENDITPVDENDKKSAKKKTSGKKKNATANEKEI